MPNHRASGGMRVRPPVNERRFTSPEPDVDVDPPPVEAALPSGEERWCAVIVAVFVVGAVVAIGSTAWFAASRGWLPAVTGVVGFAAALAAWVVAVRSFRRAVRGAGVDR